MMAALELLRRQAQLAEQNALAAMAHSRDIAAQERVRLKELQDYPAPNTDGLHDRWTLLNQQAFAQRLQQALRLQQRQVEQMEAEATQKRAKWEAAHHATEQLSRLIEKRQQEADQRTEKRVQREIDDRSVQRASRMLAEFAL